MSPVYLSVPLPGPFRYSRRLGGWNRAHRSRFTRLWWYLTGACLAELCFWLLYLLAYMLVLRVVLTWTAASRLAWRMWSS